MEEVRIGVYVCHCGLNIAGTVDVEEVAKYAATLPWVMVSRDYRYMCSDPGQNLIKKDIKELKLNRVVVASCSPRLHENTFRQACQDAGLNPYLYEHVNIREQCSWIHIDREIATEKAKDLVRAAVRRVRWHEPLEVKYAPVNPNVLIVGGGIAGIQAALDIADAEQKVYLVEREPSIGGHMIQLDRTFPTLDCSECILTPKMTEVGQHPYIELLAYSEVEEVSGSVGNFKVKVRKKARHIDETKCVGCGVCEEKCPWKVPSEFEMGLGKRGIAYIPLAQAVPNLAVIDTERCVYIQSGGKKCGACIKFCEAGAITPETLLNQTDQITELEVGSIIMATGYDQLDPSVIPQYGYGKYENVLTGLQFERMTCAGGPTRGRIQLRDGKEPESVAIIHCVGSRDKNYHEYCSRVCCMYALKYAWLVKELLPTCQVYDFYIDMRCVGENYEEFYERVSRQQVIFNRGIVSEIYKEGGKLIVCAEDTLMGNPLRLPVDMVILCCAIEPRADAGDMARRFTIGQREDGFFLETHPKLAPINTPTDGVFIAGCCQGPRDIPDTVAQGSAAAAKALALISRGKVIMEAAIATVNENLCRGCGECEKICTFHAPKVISKNGVMVSVVNESLCKGCGACAVRCPSGAMSIRHFTPRQILSMIRALTEV
jgi:heterodisulfide reductase subunit A